MPIKQVNSNMLEKLMNNTLLGKGATNRSLRQVVYDKIKSIVHKNCSIALEEKTLEDYTHKIALCAYKITEKDIQQLEASGYSQAQIFELTTVAALSAGKTRLDVVVELLQSQKS